MAVPNMMDPLQWLRQHLAELDEDLARSMVAEFAQQLRARTHRLRVQCRLWRADAGAHEQPQWLSLAARVGHAGGHDRAGDPEAPPRQLLPAVASGATARAEQGDGRGHRSVLRRGRLDPTGGRHREREGITSLSKSQVSELAKSLDTKVEQFRNRPLDAGPYSYGSTRSPRTSGRRAGSSRLRSWSWSASMRPAPAGHGRDHQRRRRGLDRVLLFARRPEASRCAAGDLRRARRAQGRDRCGCPARAGNGAAPTSCATC